MLDSPPGQGLFCNRHATKGSKSNVVVRARSTHRRASVAAARRHNRTNPTNDLKWVSTATRACMLSSTLHTSCVCGDSSQWPATGRLPRAVSCVGGAAPPPQPTGCGGDYFFGTSEGAQPPQQLELRAQQPLSQPSRYVLTAPSWPHRCAHAARARRKRQPLDGIPPRPRRRRRQHRCRPLHRPPQLPPVRCARSDRAARTRTLRSLTVATAHRSRRHGTLTSRPRRPRLIRPCSPRFRRV